MKATLNHPSDLLFDQLRDIHSVESQVSRTLPDLSRLATFSGLRGMLTHQTTLTLQQICRVAAIFERHGLMPGDDESKGMKGLIEGGNEHLTLPTDDAVRDLMLIAHYSRIKAYEIAAYHFAASLAASIGYDIEAAAISELLEEERASALALESLAAALFARP